MQQGLFQILFSFPVFPVPASHADIGEMTPKSSLQNPVFRQFDPKTGIINPNHHAACNAALHPGMGPRTGTAVFHADVFQIFASIGKELVEICLVFFPCISLSNYRSGFATPFSSKYPGEQAIVNSLFLGLFLASPTYRPVPQALTVCEPSNSEPRHSVSIVW